MPELLLVMAALIELVGGGLIVLGYKARWAALRLFLFLIPVTYIFKAFGRLRGSRYDTR